MGNIQDTDLFQPTHQPLQGLRVLVLPPALQEALHLELLEDHCQMGIWT